MPLYPYRCTQCGHQFEKIQHFHSKPEKICPQCGGGLERTLTAPGLHFKGGGFYVNDYASKSSAPAAEAAPADAKTEVKSKTEAAGGSNAAPGSASSGSAGPTPGTTPVTAPATSK